MSSEIGTDLETEENIQIGDTARQSGLYILGKPGMGKSNLIETLVLSDIAKENGVFFLDPHGDAIDNIAKYLIVPEDTNIRILNPEDEAYSFGINPLLCRDLTSLKERTDTYTRAYNIFYKIWEEDWGGWLQLIVQNTLYVFLENPDYTLADVPLFYTNENFRHHLVSNVKYNLDVKDFWQTRFGSKREYDQQRQVDAALTRISTLLGHPYIKHIIGQKKTTIDFSKILAEGDIIFLKLSAALAPDIKKFIGLIVIGELLHYVRRRPVDKRQQFCVFIDEFQKVASSDDLATFITEARKFGIGTTIAHQERLGQLGDNKKMMGATLATANKVFFQMTIKDAEELAGEFAKPPPTETRREQELVISQNPVSDLLRGHSNPQIRAFVNQYLRPLQERTEDIREDMELERLTRDDYRDRAGIERILAQINAPKSRYDDNSAQLAALKAAMSSLLFARTQTDKLAGFLKSSKELRQVIRGLNRFLTGIIEGRIARGQEIFSQFLIAITRVHEFSLVPEEYRPVLELYLSLQYGDPKIPRAIPFNFAKSIQLFSDTVAVLQHEAEGELRREQEAFLREEWEPYHRNRKRHEEHYHGKKQIRQKEFFQELSAPKLQFKDWVKCPAPYYDFVYDPDVYEDGPRGIHMFFGSYYLELYMLFHEYSSVKDIVWRYCNDRFISPWKDKLNGAVAASWLLQIEKFFRSKSLDGLEYYNYNHKPHGLARTLFGNLGPHYDYFFSKGLLFEIDLLDGFYNLVKRYGEGAVITLIILDTLHNPEQWLEYNSLQYYGEFEFYDTYDFLNMLHLPSLANTSPLEVFLSLGKLADLLPRLNLEKDLRKYQWGFTESYYQVRKKSREELRNYRDKHGQPFKGAPNYL